MKFEHKAKLFLLLLLVLVPVFQLPAVMDIALVPRFICLTVVLTVGLFLCYKDLPKTKYLTILDGAFLLYFLLSLLSCIWAHNTANALFEAQKVFAVFMTFLALRFLWLKSEGRMIPFALCCNILLTVIVIIGTIMQMDLLGGQSIRHQLFYMAQKVFRELTGFSAQKNLLSSFLYLTLVINALALTVFTLKKWRIGLGMLILFQVYLLLLFQTRSVYIAGLISFVVFLIGLQLISRFFNYKRLLIAGGGVLLILALLWARLNLVDDDFDVYLQKMNIASYLESGSAQERIQVWQKTGQMIREYPMTGVGAGNWAVFFPKYGLENTEAAEKAIFFQRPHNDFIWTFSELGIFGFLTYLSLFVLMFWSGIYIIRKLGNHKVSLQIWILLSGLLGYMLIASLSFPKERLEHQIWLVLIFSLIAYYSKDYWEKLLRINISKLQNGLLLAVILSGLLLNLMIGYHRYKGEKAMKNVYQASISTQQKKKDIKTARSFFYTLDHVGFPISWYAGTIARGEGDGASALQYFEEAYEMNPYNYQVINDLATSYGESGKPEKAIIYLKESYAINPKAQTTIFNLAILHYRIKDYKTAIQWTEKLDNEYPQKSKLLQELRSKEL